MQQLAKRTHTAASPIRPNGPAIGGPPWLLQRPVDNVVVAINEDNAKLHNIDHEVSRVVVALGRKQPRKGRKLCSMCSRARPVRANGSGAAAGQTDPRRASPTGHGGLQVLWPSKFTSFSVYCAPSRHSSFEEELEIYPQHKIAEVHERIRNGRRRTLSPRSFDLTACR